MEQIVGEKLLGIEARRLIKALTVFASSTEINSTVLIVPSLGS